MTSMARCCQPVPGDPICGYITRGRGVTIHRDDCPNALRWVREDNPRLDPGSLEKTAGFRLPG